jgi:signal transduction histidine kinase
MSSGLRGYLFTGEPYFIQAYDSAVQENREIIKELSTLIERTSQKRSLVEIDSLHRYWINEYANPLIAAKEASTLSDSSMHAFNQLYRMKLLGNSEKRLHEHLQRKFRIVINTEYELRESHKKELDTSLLKVKNISFYLTTLSFFLGLLITVLLANFIGKRINTMVKMADTIASGNYQVNMPDKGKNELSNLARSLNHMSMVLAENFSLLQRKNKELDQFAHIVSHDLKAPLRGIDNVVSWVEEDHDHELSPKVKEYLSLIKGRVLRAQALIEGILQYSRIGKEKVELEFVDLNAMLMEIKENLQLTEEMTILVHPLPVFKTERLPLMQIFTNLIDNAIKYNNKENPVITIYHHHHDNQHYIFFVEDNGPGIDKTYHKKIFEIFQTLQTRDTFESAGVGLAIVKKILEDRDQIIKITSEPGKGSVFSFTWPKYAYGKSN